MENNIPKELETKNSIFEKAENGKTILNKVCFEGIIYYLDEDLNIYIKENDKYIQIYNEYVYENIKDLVTSKSDDYIK